VVSSISKSEHELQADVLRAIIGKYDGAPEKIRKLYETLSQEIGVDMSIPYALTQYSNREIYDGRVGGLVLLFEMITEQIQAFRPLFGPEEFRAAMICVVYLASMSTKIFDNYAMFGSIPKQETLSLIKKVEESSGTKDFTIPAKEIVESTIYGICTDTIPDITVSRIVYRAWKASLDALSENVSSGRAAVGSLIDITGGELRVLWPSGY
jgi:hypothetical protein